MHSATRYAVFFAPSPESALWRFGSAVLGYDAATGHEVDQFVPSSVLRETWRALTEEPRRYGFHATLKAPFRLAEGATEPTVIAALQDFCRTETPFGLALEVSRLDSFIALTPTSALPLLAVLERKIVEVFDCFRGPLNEAERARRLSAPLTPRQREFLDRFGYPYVLDEFRFHMTLSGRLPVELLPGAMQQVKDAFTALSSASVVLDRLAVFREEGGRFRIVTNIPFG
jgi:putative phosphonate metabolism protein